MGRLVSKASFRLGLAGRYGKEEGRYNRLEERNGGMRGKEGGREGGRRGKRKVEIYR